MLFDSPKASSKAMKSCRETIPFSALIISLLETPDFFESSS